MNEWRKNVQEITRIGDIVWGFFKLCIKINTLCKSLCTEEVTQKKGVQVTNYWGIIGMEALCYCSLKSQIPLFFIFSNNLCDTLTCTINKRTKQLNYEFLPFCCFLYL